MRRIFALIIVVAVTAYAHSGEGSLPRSTTAALHAKAALVGMQLSIRKAHAEGKIPDGLHYVHGYMKLVEHCRGDQPGS